MESPNPLTELTNVKQQEEGIFKRTFVDGDNDLVIWYDSGRKNLIGFQLSIYDIAITFNRGRLKIEKIDYSEKDNYSPILNGSADIDISKVIEYLNNNNQYIEKELLDYIMNALTKEHF